MNRSAVFFFVVLAAIFAILALPASASPGDDHKITICHVPPGNPGNAHEIEVDKSAWENGHSPHNAHSLDYVGGCEKEEPTDVPTTPANTSTPQPTVPNPSHTPRPTDAPVWPTEPIDTPTATRVGTPTVEDAPTATASFVATEPKSSLAASCPTLQPTHARELIGVCCQLPVFSAQAEADDNQPITYGILYVLAGFIGGATFMAILQIAANLRKR